MATIEVWLKAGHTVEIIRRLLPRFQELSGHEVRIAIVPEDRAHDELMSGEHTPDVVTAPFWYLDELQQRGALSALSLQDIGLHAYDFVEQALDCLSKSGTLLAIPHTLTGGVLSYRADLLEAASLSEPRTLKDTVAVAAALRAARYPSLIARANPEFSSLETYAGWAAARGIKILPDSGVSDLSDIERGCGDLVSALCQDGERLVETNYAGLGQMMIDGDASMLFDTSAWSFQFEDAASPIRGRMEYTVLSESHAAQFRYAEGLAIPSWSRFPGAAREFIAWRHSEEVVRAEIEQIGRIDFPRWDIRESTWFKAYVREHKLSSVLKVIDQSWAVSTDAHVAYRPDFVAAARRLIGVMSETVDGRSESLGQAYEVTYRPDSQRR